MDKIEVSQRAREKAFDAYMTCFETVPNDLWLQALLDGKHDSDEMAQAFARFERDILATRTDATPVVEPRTIYVQWADNGNIRKWAWSEFDLAEKLKVETTPVSDTPFAWAYHYTRKHPGQTKPGAMDIKRDRHTGPIGAGWTVTPLYTHPPATDVAALVEALELVGKILPSAAGLDDAPDSKVIACYMNMGELRAIKATLAALKDRTHD